MKPRKTPYWWAVIEKAKARKKAGKLAFTALQNNRADSWVTCACGKQDPQLPRDQYGMPQDHDLRDLGVTFWAEVDSNNPIKAERVLRKIERRAADILASLS